MTVTSEKRLQRNLHTFVGMMRGRYNTCLSQQKNGSFAPKVDYKSQETAAKSALRLTEKWGKQFDAYQCWFCKGWHIGGAANLTLWKFLSIAVVWLFGKKRAGNKYRLKAYVRAKQVECQRCHKGTFRTILSMFTMEEICKECEDAEKQRPDYEAAKQADEDAIRSGDFNFRGIGF
jgi:hypothetical protein